MLRRCCDCGVCSFYNRSFEATSFVIGTEPGSEWTVLSGTWEIQTGKYLGGYNDGGQIEFDYTVGLSGTDINSYQVAAQSLSFDFYAEENDVFSFKVFGNDEYTIQFNMLSTGSSGGTGTVELLDGSTVIKSETHDGDPAQWNAVVICWAEAQEFETATEKVFVLHVTVNGTEAFKHPVTVTIGADPSMAVMPTDVIITSENDGGTAHFILFDNFSVQKNGADCEDCLNDLDDCGCYDQLESKATFTLDVGFIDSIDQWYEGTYELRHAVTECNRSYEKTRETTHDGNDIRQTLTASISSVAGGMNLVINLRNDCLESGDFRISLWSMSYSVACPDDKTTLEKVDNQSLYAGVAGPGNCGDQPDMLDAVWPDTIEVAYEW